MRYPGLLLLLFLELRLNGGFDFFVERGIVFQRFLRRIAALRQLRAFVVQPGTAFLDDLFFEREIEQRAGRGNSLVIHDVELGLGERRRDFVLHDFHARAIAGDDAVGLFDRADAADIDAHAGVEF